MNISRNRCPDSQSDLLCVSPDGIDGDKIGISDASWIAQCVAGVRDAYFE
ncbi:hypothetical protein ACFLUJ_04790 [Chloroflexota bacterium]